MVQNGEKESDITTAVNECPFYIKNASYDRKYPLEATLGCENHPTSR
jgi:hypothetical protein